MLTAASVLATLGSVFERSRVAGILDQMARTGFVRPRRQEPFSPHNAIIAMLASALPYDAAKALAQAMVMRDWHATGPVDGRRLALGVEPESIRDIRSIRLACSQVYCKQPSGWWISPVECVSDGLRFSAGHYANEVPAFIKRSYVSVPGSVLAEFGRHHGLVHENERQANAQLLGRIARSLRPEKIEAEAAE
jgi:hypothetical protein